MINVPSTLSDSSPGAYDHNMMMMHNHNHNHNGIMNYDTDDEDQSNESLSASQESTNSSFLSFSDDVDVDDGNTNFIDVNSKDISLNHHLHDVRTNNEHHHQCQSMDDISQGYTNSSIDEYGIDIGTATNQESASASNDNHQRQRHHTNNNNMRFFRRSFCGMNMNHSSDECEQTPTIPFVCKKSMFKSEPMTYFETLALKESESVDQQQHDQQHQVIQTIRKQYADKSIMTNREDEDDGDDNEEDEDGEIADEEPMTIEGMNLNHHHHQQGANMYEDRTPALRSFNSFAENESSMSFHQTNSNNNNNSMIEQTMTMNKCLLDSTSLVSEEEVVDEEQVVDIEKASHISLDLSKESKEHVYYHNDPDAMIVASSDEVVEEPNGDRYVNYDDEYEEKSIQLTPIPSPVSNIFSNTSQMKDVIENTIQDYSNSMNEVFVKSSSELLQSNENLSTTDQTSIGNVHVANDNQDSRSFHDLSINHNEDDFSSCAIKTASVARSSDNVSQSFSTKSETRSRNYSNDHLLDNCDSNLQLMSAPSESETVEVCIGSLSDSPRREVIRHNSFTLTLNSEQLQGISSSNETNDVEYVDDDDDSTKHGDLVFMPPGPDVRNGNSKYSLLFVPHSPTKRRKFVISSFVCKTNQDAGNDDRNFKSKMPSGYHEDNNANNQLYLPPLHQITTKSASESNNSQQSSISRSLKTLKMQKGLKIKKSFIRTKKKKQSIMRSKPKQRLYEV